MLVAGHCLVGALLCIHAAGAAAPMESDPALPTPIAVAHYGDDGGMLVLRADGQLLLMEASGKVLRSVALGARATGMALRGDVCYVTTDEPAGQVLVVDVASGEAVRRYRVGHTPTCPVLSRDGKALYVANRFDNTVALLDLATGAVRVVKVIREPVGLALNEEGSRLFAGNLLPEVRPFLDDENPIIAAEVSVVDTGSGRVLTHIELPNGSQSLRGMALSPDGRHVVVAHLLGNYVVPTMGIEGGAMNRNAISLIDTKELYRAATIVLDEADRGAANPWAVAFVPGRQGEGEDASAARLLVTHAGTHEISVINWPGLLARISERGTPGGYFDAAAFGMIEGIRERVPLPVNGPRALSVQGKAVCVTGYFSGDMAALEFSGGAGSPRVRAIPIPGGDGSQEPSGQGAQSRRGERYFNDATICFQGWQSCASCHPDGHSDVLYWDLLNDGMGNTKNTKSLMMATLTPPAMWRGVRADAGMAVRAGIKHIQFAAPEPGQAEAIEAYLEAMKATPSPYLDAGRVESPKTGEASCGKCHHPGVPRGTLTESARRGKALFEGKAGCVTCHPHPYFTTMESVDPGLGSAVLYDVPSLVGVWRTAPYLHSGDALSIEETITDFNYLQRRGNTRDLTEAELGDLVAYVRSL